MNSKNYPTNKPMATAGVGYVVLFILFIIAKSRFPDTGGGWSDPPIIDYLFFLGAGICLSIIASGYTYYSWILTEEEYIKWYSDQQLFGGEFIKSRARLYPSGAVIWMNRIIAPIGALIGLALIIFALFSIFKFIL